jgi:hypothetical protein
MSLSLMLAIAGIATIATVVISAGQLCNPLQPRLQPIPVRRSIPREYVDRSSR